MRLESLSRAEIIRLESHFYPLRPIQSIGTHEKITDSSMQFTTHDKKKSPQSVLA